MITASNRLSDWRETYKKTLEETLVKAACQIADDCYLAYATIPGEGGNNNGLTSFPSEAIISATRFGTRLPSRPHTRQPAVFAAYILRNRGVPDEAINAYLEALLRRDLIWNECQKYLADCHKIAVAAAKATEVCLLNGLTKESLKGQFSEARELAAELKGKGTLMEATADRLIPMMHVRATLLPRIKAGEFNHLPPIVGIHTLHRILGDHALAPGYTTEINFAWPPDYIRPMGAYLYSVPVWYPFWTGQIPWSKKANKMG